MHAFEQGKLIIMPNTLLSFSLGSHFAIVFLLMWAGWLFLLIALMTPLGGRIWCTISDYLSFLGFLKLVAPKTNNS